MDTRNFINEKKGEAYFWWMAVVFLLLTVSFVIDFWGQKREIITHRAVDSKYFTKEPVRQAKFEPVILQDGYTYRCMDCHEYIKPSDVQKSFFSAHSDIILSHGANNYCMTCHSPNNRNMLTDINKNEVPFSESQKTCLQCHGPIYRDWEKGVHGRMNDSWDKEKRVTKKLSCVSCHDPHDPEFKAMQPAPAPYIENYRNFLDDLAIKETVHE